MLESRKSTFILLVFCISLNFFGFFSKLRKCEQFLLKIIVFNSISVGFNPVLFCLLGNYIFYNYFVVVCV